VRFEIVILQHNNKPIANLALPEFRSLFQEEQLTELLSAPGDVNIKIRAYNLDAGLTVSNTCNESDYAVYLANWVKSGDVKEAMAKTALDKTGSGPSVIDLLAMSSDMVPVVHPNVSDALIDCLISIIQDGDENDVEKILHEWCCTGWNLTNRDGTDAIHLVLANYLFYNHCGEVRKDLLDNTEGQEIADVVNAWKRDLWKTKDWSVVPQDIKAQDFNDHCHYHYYKDRCWRDSQG
jgi:hypothetical protein